MKNVLCIILGGGKGTRLFPLTKERAKPAVPFGGKYRLVDIPISNCINSDLLQIYLLTQFNSTSLHLHITNTYRFDHFSGGFVELLAANQGFEDSGWYQGTADAVRKNMDHFRNLSPDYYMILSGDQLYRMDLADFLDKHIANKADITIACTPVTHEETRELGILKVDKKSRIEAFLEKPGPEVDISDYMISDNLTRREGDHGKDFLASMGIYIFSSRAMEEALNNEMTDFGKEIIPHSLSKSRVFSYTYHGYWEDIGTIKSFFESSLNLASITPKFNLYDMDRPLYTHRRDLPPSKLNDCTMNNALASEGSIITNSAIRESIVGIRTIIENGAYLERVICMGSNHYETDADREENRALGRPNIGIGQMCMIRNAIIDINARIGQGCRIGTENTYREDVDNENYYVRDGIIIIPKNAVIPDGTMI